MHGDTRDSSRWRGPCGTEGLETRAGHAREDLQADGNPERPRTAERRGRPPASARAVYVSLMVGAYKEDF